MNIPTHNCISAKEFSIFLEAMPDAEKKVPGTSVLHAENSYGSITNVIERKNYIPLLHIFYKDLGKEAICNSEIFKSDLIKFVYLQNELFEEYKQWKEQYQKKILLEKEIASGIAEFNKLIQKYGIQTHLPKNTLSNFFPILLKIENHELLSDDELNLLITDNCNYALAAYYYRIFARNETLYWEGLKACKYLRKIQKSSQVIEITSQMLEQKINEKKALAAIYTSRGAAHCDLGKIQNAINCGEMAISHNSYDPHPYNLIGRAYYLDGQPNMGDKYFEEAEKRGSSHQHKDQVIKSTLKLSDKTNQAIIAEYLIAKNPEKYKWALSYLN